MNRLSLIRPYFTVLRNRREPRACGPAGGGRVFNHAQVACVAVVIDNRAEPTCVLPVVCNAKARTTTVLLLYISSQGNAFTRSIFASQTRAGHRVRVALVHGAVFRQRNYNTPSRAALYPAAPYSSCIVWSYNAYTVQYTVHG